VRTTSLHRSIVFLACGVALAACANGGVSSPPTEATIDGNETAGKDSAAGSGAVGHLGGAGSGGSHVVGVVGGAGSSVGGAPSAAFGGSPSTSTGGRAGGGSGGKASAGGSNTSAGSAGAPAPTVGCDAPTTYPNLFVTVSGHTQAESDAKLAAAWSQLFGTGANTVYYKGPGADESYVQDVANNDVRTEGMSYGMMIALQLDHQDEFDRLWAFVKNHMAQASGQYAWHTSTSGSKLATGGAPDGDEYFAAALVFAAKRWGNTSGKYDYAKEAKVVLDMIRTQDFNDKAKLVQFYVGSGNTDGSYILPAFYQSWACFDAENAAFWNSAVSAGRAFFQAAVDSNMVIGDQSSFTGQTVKGAGSDTVRCVMNIMMDHNFFHADPWQETYATKYGAYQSKGAGSTAQLSCNGLLGFGLPAATGKPFVDKLWSAAIPTGQYRYYDGTLYLLALLHVSGTFKLWY